MRPASHPAGFTLYEIVLVITLMLIAGVLAAPRYVALRDRIAVDGAASGIVRALVDARAAAIRLGARAAVAVDTQTASLAVHMQGDTLAQIRLRDLFGVALTSSRDSMAYSATGLGFGATNSSLVVRRGAAAETVSVSRTGRVRR
jgi:type II secretory pathway pseudopilin PulG